MKLSCPSSWTISLQQKPVPCRTWTKKPYPGKNKEPHDARSRPASTETKGKNQTANNSTGNVVPFGSNHPYYHYFFFFLSPSNSPKTGLGPLANVFGGECPHELKQFFRII
ncbi:hypothetical protein TWF225_011035 [Orbilia oligospora]|uniref:Uncharacterized protein n=1 Tax=Orbilia oligospora TaxID=2813651 RepID=A0A7C8P920_ORBOL|nr:hypothetical protein TWF751_009764 [Orbilia oligospora]KAF3193199.1 hypothetical protein TWF225_011035 [Orbilia oligospora]KAF3246548.1 hypothetical protein TWF217_009888 [Orbilia oligospora]KAF3271667.1 hypothetical protein TWF128_000226 [Orbilia oligospora]TGJ72577.1 hypothetical protein EYR41_004461 [Orbilia oligospora]